MGCINITVNPVAPTVLGVTPQEGVSMDASPVAGASLEVIPAKPALIGVTPAAPSALQVTPQDGCRLTIGEICSVSGGTIVVLAAADGPLRLRGGGYLLLDPEANPAE